MSAVRRRFVRRSRLALLALSLAALLAGCETLEKLNPLVEKQTPLPGERKPLFPEGVPGVEFGAAPPQPSNANIPIPTTLGPNEETSQQPPSAQARATQSPQPVTQQKSSQPSKSKPDPDDAWSGTR